MKKNTHSTIDEHLLNRLRSGDEATLYKVYETYCGIFTKWVIGKYGVSEEEGADVFQESVITLYENAVQGKIKANSSLKTYLFAVGKNILLKRLHHRGHLSANVVLDDLENTIGVNADNFSRPLNARQALVAKLMEEIGEPCKTILELFYFYNWSMSEIAERMEYSNANVAKTQKSRCVKRLQKMV